MTERSRQEAIEHPTIWDRLRAAFLWPIIGGILLGAFLYGVMLL